MSIKISESFWHFESWSFGRKQTLSMYDMLNKLKQYLQNVHNTYEWFSRELSPLLLFQVSICELSGICRDCPFLPLESSHQSGNYFPAQCGCKLCEQAECSGDGEDDVVEEDDVEVAQPVHAAETSNQVEVGDTWKALHVHCLAYLSFHRYVEFRPMLLWIAW